MAYYTRSRALSLAEHKAAGVLPFSIHEGAVLVLLGAEPCKTGPGGKVWRTMWRDFGGGREAADADSAATAAREFAEETLGLFGTCAVNQAGVLAAAAAMEAQLRDSSQAIKVVHALRKGAYHFYCTQTPWVAPLMFRLASQQNAATCAVAGAEKSAFAWVPMTELLECVAVAAPRYFLETRAHVCGGPGTPPAARCGRRRFQLHPCFANSLRMAQKCGLDGLMAHAHELPLPPPPPLPLPLVVPVAGPAASEAGAAGSAQAAASSAAAAPAELVADSPAGEMGEEEGLHQAGSDALQGTLAYWLGQEDIGVALRGSTPAAGDAAGDADLPSGIWLPPSQQQQQQVHGAQGRGRRQQRSSLTAAAGAGQCGSVSVSPRVAALPAASGSSLGRASSVDTASSLRQHREAVAAAAVEQVVHQIEQNSHLRQRPSRKQRQKLRRQRLRAEEAAVAAAAAADAAVAGAPESPPPPPPPPRQQQQEAGAPTAGCTSPAASVPPHWARAMRELEATFQPHVRAHKRLRIVVG